MHRTEVVSTLQFFESIVSVVLHWISMELFGWFGFVVFCSLWIRALASGMGSRFLSDMHGASPILLEIGYWDVVLCVWASLSIIVVLAISMARSKNTGKGKAPSSSMERAIKKIKSDTSQPIKKGKGK